MPDWLRGTGAFWPRAQSYILNPEAGAAKANRRVIGQMGLPQPVAGDVDEGVVEAGTERVAGECVLEVNAQGTSVTRY